MLNVQGYVKRLWRWLRGKPTKPIKPEDAIAAMVKDSVSSLDTLTELASAIQESSDFLDELHDSLRREAELGPTVRRAERLLFCRMLKDVREHGEYLLSKDIAFDVYVASLSSRGRSTLALSIMDNYEECSKLYRFTLGELSSEKAN